MSAPEEFKVQRAERKQARLRLAVTGASNGGKTWTALLLAFGIVDEFLVRGVLQGTLEGKVGLVDTERRSAQLYAHLGPFDTVELDPPYSVERYVGAQRALERAGCAVIILDSISHAWEGKGGVLELLNSVEDWQKFSAYGTKVKPAQHELVDGMLRSPCHIIATMRSKTAWVLQDVEKRVSGGGTRTVKEPRRVGMAPIQRPGIEYEFTTLLDLDTDTHAARVLKNRCPVFEGWTPRVLTREHGRQLAAWLLEGAPVPAGPVSGSPLERAQAVRDAGLRALERAGTVPDLAVAFERVVRDLKAFPPSVSVEEIRPMLEAVIEAKDLRKDALRPTLPPRADPGPAKTEPPKDPREVLSGITEKIAGRRPGLFSDMKDDIPF